MIQIKFINATNVQLLDQSNNVVSNKGSFDGTPIQFTYSGNDFSINDQNYYHFAITGSNVQLSGIIDSVTTKQQFMNLFRGCEAITDASQLQLTATSLTEGCYANMFLDCKNLTTPPVLSATTLAMWCYSSMFGNCYSLTAAPALVATTLAKYCYYCMFYGCSSLSTAPTLPATSLTDWCYNSMFYKCTELTSISCDFTSWSPSNATSNWVKGIDTVGEFYNDDVLEIYGDSNIPLTWYNLIKAPLTFTAMSSNSKIKLTKNRLDDADIVMSYNKNKTGWTTYTLDSIIDLDNGDVIAFSGANDHFSDTYLYDTKYYYFAMTGAIEARGNVNSLINFSLNIPTSGCFVKLFYNCSSLLTAPSLPATELTNICYLQMFAGCSSLSVAPALPATGLADSCYQGMFNRCTSLTSIPILPATQLADKCYTGMYDHCTAISTVPYNLLPATSLAEGCYRQMFWDCTALTSAPSLPATTLAPSCYTQMFAYCSSLKTSPQLPATTLAPSCYYNMFASCTSITNAPYLPATTLVSSCYGSMFYGCSNLSSITISFTEWGETGNWVYGVADNGTFIKPATLLERYGTSYIPSNWTITDK